MQRACIYRLKDRVLLHPESRTEAGIWVAVEPCVSLPRTVEPESLGSAIVDALKHSVENVPHPNDWKVFSQSRLKAAGVKSESVFYAGSQLVAVVKSANGFIVEPHHNGGTSGSERGFQELPALEITLGNGTQNGELGIAVLEAFAKCTTAT